MSLFSSPTLAYLNFFADEKSAIDAISHQNIKVARIEPLNAYILNYDQIESNPTGFKKRHPIIRECRNLVVRYTPSYQWQIIGKSFSRFFNWGESPEDAHMMDHFFANDQVTAFEKLDGSLILISYIDGEWRVFTRGSYADTNPFRGTLTTQISESDTFGSRVRQYVDLSKLDPAYYYVFELCTPGAHITKYDMEFLALLAVVNSTTLDEVPYPLPEKFTMISPDPTIPIRQPASFHIHSFNELQQILALQAPDFEGYVLLARLPGTDIHFRIKVKSESYVTMHHLGTKTFTLEDLCRVVVTGEEAEVSGILTAHKTILEKLTNLYRDATDAIVSFYLDNAMLTRKVYAQYVCEREPLPHNTEKKNAPKTNLPTPIPDADHPAASKYAAITKDTFRPFNWLYFDLHMKKIVPTIHPDGSTDIRELLSHENYLNKTVNSLANLYVKSC